MKAWKPLSVGAVVLGLFGVRLSGVPAAASPEPPPFAFQALIHHYNGDVPLPGACWGMNADIWRGNDIPLPVQAPSCPAPAPRPAPPSGNNAVVVIGQTWGPELFLGHSHGASGPVSVRIRPNCINGPCVGTACFPSELLISGTLMSTIPATHNGVSCVVPSQNIPNNPALVGLPWACQATVAGGGCVDLSSALLGVIGDMF